MKIKQVTLSIRPRSFLVGLGVMALATTTSPAWAQPTDRDEKGAAPRLTKPPRLVRFVEAPYPESERSPPGQRAPRPPVTVVLRLAIDASGAVTAVDIDASGAGGAAFDEAAREAARRFVFEPAEIDGRPAPIRILYRYQFTERFERRQNPTLRGVVRDATGAPVSGAEVSLDTGERASTDAAGAFTITDVAVGTRTVTLRAPGAPPQVTEEELVSGRDLDAVYTIAQPETPSDEVDDAEVVVVAPRLRKDVVSTEVPASEGRTMAGTQGDVLRVVENLPGVARSAAGSGQLVVWGAAPTDTRVYLDGVKIPSLYHLGGLRSVIHGDAVESIDLTPGGYGAAYGRAMGGLVLVRTKALFDPERPTRERRLRLSASVDTIDSAVYAEAPIGQHLTLAVGGRRSHLAPLMHTFSNDGLGELVPLPRFFDGIVRFGVQASPHDDIEIGALGSFDELLRTVSSTDPLGDKRDARRQGFSRLFGRWIRSGSNGDRVTVTPSVGEDKQRVGSRFGGVDTLLDQQTTVIGLRITYETRLHPRVTLLAGFDGEGTTSSLHRQGSVGSPAREGDARVFGQAPADRVSVDRWTVTQTSLAPFAELDWAPMEALHVTPGMRIEPSLSSVSRRTPAVGETPETGAFRQDTYLSPRLAARLALSPTVTLKAAVGDYRQPASPEDLSATVGNPLLGPSRSRHALLGTDITLSEDTSLALTSFFTQQQDLAVRSPLSAPLLAEGLVQTGEGRSFGSQMLLRRSGRGRLSGWLGYTIARSERRRSAAAADAYRLFDFDQTHVLTAVGTIDLGRGVSLGGRLRYATGQPRTPVVGTFFDNKRDLEQPLFGPVDSVRLPAFFSVDARLSKRWRFAPFELEAFVEVQNATNRRNAEEWLYASDYRSRTTLNGLPLLPAAGARWSL